MPAPAKKYYRRKAAPAATSAPKRYYRRKTYTGIPRMSGRGAYTYSKPGPWGKYGRAIGSQVAKATLGRYLGDGLASGLGAKAGSYAHYIGKIFGSGDYVTSSAGIKSNNLMGAGAQAPLFTGAAQQMRIRHREYLGDIISSATANTFQIQSFSINPGLNQCFPWLSQVVGATFQQYRLNGMVFEFRSMASDALNSTNTALGSVVMATDYDSKDLPFTSKAQMENTMFGVSCKPSCSMIHAIECARHQTAVSELYIRAGSVPSGADVRLYDMGTFYIATNGMQGTSVNVGELWVSYDVTAFKPIEQPPGYLIPSAKYDLDPSTLGTKTVQPLLTSLYNVDNIGLTFDATGTIIQFPLNTPLNSLWLIQWMAFGTGTASATPLASVTGHNGMSAQGFTNGNLAGSFDSPSPSGAAGVNTTAQTYTKVYRYTGGATPAALPNLQFAAAATPLSAYSYGTLMVTMVNSGFINPLQ